MTRGIYLMAVTAVSAVLVGCGDNQPASLAAQGATEGTATSGTSVMPDARHRALRLLSPLSGSYSSSRQPIFQWTPDTAATVQICDDRACGHVFTSLSGQGSAQPDSPLRSGVVFWRVSTDQNVSAVWQLTIPGRDSGQITSWGVTPDFNGDGLADLAIGAPAAGAGSVSVFDGGPTLGFYPTPDVLLSGGDQFGRAVAAAGDVNGDGYVDLAVGAGTASGSVTVYLGGPSGPTGGTALSPGAVTTGFGATIASAGDVNGDGYGDLLVGGHEVAQIFLGGPHGIAARAALSLAGGTDNGLDGTIVQGPSDVNADGSPDLFVGGLLYLSGPAGLAPQSGFSLNIGSFAGDVNNDGFGDVASYSVSPGTPTGVNVWLTLLGAAGEFAFETAGDLNGDGYSDVIFSISSLVGVPERERVYFGGPGVCGGSGCTRFSAINIPGHTNPPDGTLSALIAAAGDLDGDGLDDLVASTPDTGTVSVFRDTGESGAPISFSFPFFTGPVGFGAALPTIFGSALPTL